MDLQTVGKNLQRVTFQEKGYSLIELLTCLSLLAILLSFTVSVTSLYKKNQLQTITDDIKKAFQFAKMQALISGKTLLLAPLPPSKDWSAGMVLFVDPGNHQYTSDIKPLQKWQWHFTGITITWHGFQSRGYLLFTPDINSSTLNGYFIIKNSIQQIKLVINRIGRIKQEDAL
jgi:prepilin-type N-terminal cleavage/methylation domain-containing protein